MYINKAIVYGNLTRDPELRALPSGGQVCSMSIATNRVFKKADGTKQEQVEYHNIVVFGRQAETSAQYLKKGAGVFVEGRIQTRSWDKDGQKQYRTEIIADRIQFGPRTGTSGAGTASDGQRDEASPQQAPKEDSIDYPEEAINPDDIPF